MKRSIITIAFFFLACVAFCQQNNTEKNEKIQAEIMAIEKAGWQAWQDKNVDWYKTNTTEDFLMVLGAGTRNKAEVLKATSGECDVKSFALSDFKFVMLNENAVLMNYTADQDAMCGGKASATKVRASVNYVKRGGKWLEAFYTETPLTQ
jgi:hypothetical protein